ncbi:cyclin-dependent kinase 4 inhibitor C [Scomber scombrus]|nr:cyclin-dependent kinase 4 inhibitor C [Scomber scombrus]
MAYRSVDELCNASASGKLAEVKTLLQNGADVNGFNTSNRTALQVVKLGNDAVAEALLEAGANPNLHDPACGLTVTHDAAREGFIDTLRVLVKHGADVNLVDKQGNLPLHLAAKEGHLEVVKLLVGLTTDPKKSNTHNNTAGQLAHDYKRTDTAAFIDQYLSSG